MSGRRRVVPAGPSQARSTTASSSRFVRALAAVAVVGCAVVGLGAAPASAHTVGGSEPTNYVTEISSVAPVVDGISVRVVELGGRLELINTSGRTATVLGYRGEPFLRVDERGVFQNRLSPATYLNADRKGTTDVPAEAERAEATTPPVWSPVADGTTARWHDHRAHWMGNDPPPAVTAEPGRSHVIQPRWEVPLVVGDTEVVVAGSLRWQPAASPWPWVVAAAGVAVAVVVAAGRRWAPVLAVATAVLVVGDIAHAVGLAWAPATPGNPVARFAAGSVLPAVGWIAGVLGLRALVRRRFEGVFGAAMCAMTVLLVGGIGDLGALTRSQVAFVWGDVAARAAVAGSIGLGAGVLVASLVHVRRTNGSLLGPRASVAA